MSISNHADLEKVLEHLSKDTEWGLFDSAVKAKVLNDITEDLISAKISHAEKEVLKQRKSRARSKKEKVVEHDDGEHSV